MSDVGRGPDLISSGADEGSLPSRHRLVTVLVLVLVVAGGAWLLTSDPDPRSPAGRTAGSAPAVPASAERETLLVLTAELDVEAVRGSQQLGVRFAVRNDGVLPVDLNALTVRGPGLSMPASLRPERTILQGESITVDALLRVDCTRLLPETGALLLDRRLATNGRSLLYLGDIDAVRGPVMDSCAAVPTRSPPLSIGESHALVAESPTSIRVRVSVANLGDASFDLVAVQVEGFPSLPRTTLPVTVSARGEFQFLVDFEPDCAALRESPGGLRGVQLVVRGPQEEVTNVSDDSTIGPALRRLERRVCRS